jgi:hypothetical protein
MVKHRHLLGKRQSKRLHKKEETPKIEKLLHPQKEIPRQTVKAIARYGSKNNS